jgi:hypothetical protein
MTFSYSYFKLVLFFFSEQNNCKCPYHADWVIKFKKSGRITVAMMSRITLNLRKAARKRHTRVLVGGEVPPRRLWMYQFFPILRSREEDLWSSGTHLQLNSTTLDGVVSDLRFNHDSPMLHVWVWEEFAAWRVMELLFFPLWVDVSFEVNETQWLGRPSKFIRFGLLLGKMAYFIYSMYFLSNFLGVL